MPQRLAETDPSRGLLRVLLRAPIFLYRLHLGWILGRRFLLLKHVGRKTGLQHSAVLEVVRYDRSRNIYIIASGWGEKSNWLQNIEKNPEVEIEIGRRRLSAHARRLPQTQAKDELREYARQYPRAYRVLAGRMLGRQAEATEEEFDQLGKAIPVVAVEPQM